jgi:hypothetical protein
MQCTENREESPGSILRWYWVKATYKAVHLGKARRRHLWQRIVFLIRAPETDDLSPPPTVWSKAEEVARRKEHEYKAVGGETVRWVVQQIDDVRQLLDEEIIEGTEVYWEFFERVDQAVKVSTQD